MRSKLRCSWSLVGLIAKEFNNHVFEVAGEAGSIDFFEVELVLAGHEQVVEVLFLAGFFEREYTVHDDEKYNCKGKHVDFATVVGSAFFDFGRHVRECTSVALQTVN